MNQSKSERDISDTVIDFSQFRTPKTTGPPLRPRSLLSQCFECNFLTLRPIIDKIEASLSNIREIAYEYVADEYKWNAAYCYGTQYCMFNLSIYSNYDDSSYFIEGNRASDNATAFYTFFKQLKHHILDGARAPIHIDDGLSFSAQDEIYAAFNPIFRLANETDVYSRRIAAHSLCYVSMQAHMHPFISTNGSIDILAEMVTNEEEDIRRFAAIALKNLTLTFTCQIEIILSENLLSTLLPQIGDGSYANKAYRQACASIIIHLCEHSTKNIKRLILEMINKYKKDVWTQWVLTVGDIQEVSIRTEADRIVSFLGVFV